MKQITSIFIIVLLFFFSTQCNDKCKNDLLEIVNRRIYAFNRGVDKILLIPASSLYIKFIPNTINEKINNFYINISEIQNMIFEYFFYDFNHFILSFSRTIINSTFGVFGFFDIAKKSSLNQQIFNFNNSIKAYKSYYMMLPILGPGTVRTNIYLLFTQFLNPFIYYLNRLVIYYFLEIIVKRSNFMFDTTFFHNNIIDGYSFLKNIYIQNLEKGNDELDSFLNDPD